MYIFKVQMCMFGYLKTPDIILPLVSSRKLDWTHTFDTHCIYVSFSVLLRALLLVLFCPVLIIVVIVDIPYSACITAIFIFSLCH